MAKTINELATIKNIFEYVTARFLSEYILKIYVTAIFEKQISVVRDYVPIVHGNFARAKSLAARLSTNVDQAVLFLKITDKQK